MTTQFLDPRRKLVEVVAETLAAKARTTRSGVRTLDHLLVVVPTAQAGRRLRLALARRFPQGLVPPLVKMPAHLLPEKPYGAVEELYAFASELRVRRALDLKPALDLASTLIGLRRLLGENALTFAAVAARADELFHGDLADVEAARWRDLAEIEAAALAKFPPAPEAAPIPESVEEIVLPGFVSPIPALFGVLENAGKPITVLVHAAPEEADRFDEWGRPVRLPEELPLAANAIGVYGTPAGEADAVADFFAAVKPDEALPALCLADDDLYEDLQGSLQAKGVTLHNPARTFVMTSSLGHLLAQLFALQGEGRYDVFSAFIREGDVQRYLVAKLALPPEAVTNALTDLDRLKADHLPETLADVARFAAGDLKRIVDLVAGFRRLPATELLADLFADRHLDDLRAEDREFAAAALAVRELFDAVAAAHLPPEDELPVFQKLLAQASYQLEPATADVLQTDGWLELPYLAADEVVLAGFNEGKVPEAVVGHPFLPDGLRAALGLTTNEQRAARDAFILDEALRCRRPGMVRVTFHALASDSSSLKPSRLLFLTKDDADLAARVRRFYVVTDGTDETPPRTLPEAWRLDLPIPPKEVPLATCSPSALNDYLLCPFTYYLKRTFGQSFDDNVEEMQANQFGSVCHAALDCWAKGPLADSTDAEAIAAALAEAADAILAEQFGVPLPAIVELQGESIKRRLAAFAAIQAAHRAEGWKIVGTEEWLHVTYDGCRFSGCADRIEVNETTGAWQVIDYKTFDSPDKANAFETAAQVVADVESRGLPTFTTPGKKGAVKTVWRSLQLPLYCAMLEASGDARFAAAKGALRQAAYCVLGKTAEETVFTEAIDSAAYQAEAERTVRALIAKIRAGVFWPPGASDIWLKAWYDYAGLIFNTPADSVSQAWLDDQLARGGAS